MPRIDMPADWDDAAGWEAHYASLYPAGSFRDARTWLEATATGIAGNLVALIGELGKRGNRTVWFPGCGLDPLPKLFAALGLDVHATDVAPTAVRYQLSADNDVSTLRLRYAALGLKAVDPGRFTVEQHDFRDAYRAGPFRLILNFKSLQGFPEASLQRIARVHADALEPGGAAYFDTMNVQGARRDVLEGALVEAGFSIPGHAAHARMRKALADTGIPFIFIMGQPIVPRKGAYANDEDGARRDTARLRAIFAEHQAHAQAETKAEASRAGPDAKRAVMIYNTG